MRESLRGAKKEFNKTEDDLKSLQSVGQIIGEVLRPLDNERCNYSLFIFLYSSFPLKLDHDLSVRAFFIYYILILLQCKLFSLEGLV